MPTRIARQGAPVKGTPGQLPSAKPHPRISPQRGIYMINFDEEIKKFHPSLEIEDAQQAIYNQDMKDMVDVMLQMTRDGILGSESSAQHKTK